MDDSGERDDRHLARASADVDNHGACRFGDRQPHADSGGHGLFHEKDLTRAGCMGGILDRALLYPCDSAWDGYHYARTEILALDLAGCDLLDEILQHCLGDVEIGDHTHLHGTDRYDVRRRAAKHALGLEPHCEDVLRTFFDCHNGRLTKDNAFVLHVHERVRRAEIDSDVSREKTFEFRKHTAHYIIRCISKQAKILCMFSCMADRGEFAKRRVARWGHRALPPTANHKPLTTNNEFSACEKSRVVVNYARFFRRIVPSRGENE